MNIALDFLDTIKLYLEPSGTLQGLSKKNVLTEKSLIILASITRTNI